ncbi:DPP IV N-terminal domain-containing protein [Marinilabiliaceae bacterium ANBcel2]|nr:DPP IV N-terminal domain-containing protein [Marinilabiliaceae bacterium ANBcel2]
MIKQLFIFIALTLTTSIQSEVLPANYKRAKEAEQNVNKMHNHIIASGWINSKEILWYKLNTKEGEKFFLADPVKKEIKKAFNHKKVSQAITKKRGDTISPYNLPFNEIRFSPSNEDIIFAIDNIIYRYSLISNTLRKIREREASPPTHWGVSLDELSNSPVISPNKKYKAFIKEYNLHLKELETGKEYQLSYDGSQGDTYSSFILWSPDSKYLTTNKVRAHKKQYIHFVESAPQDRLKPKLHKIEYLKPGDALPVKRPKLFNVTDKKKVTINTEQFTNQFAISNVKWRNDSRAFTFEFNERGHQKYQVVEVDSQTGDVKILINETSKTFIDYRGKYFRYDIEESNEIIWTSERSGWNHLYIYNRETEKIEEITSGDWVVRDVRHIDEKERKIYFLASGREKNQDPYNKQLYKIDFNGDNLTRLTKEKKNHRVKLSNENSYFFNTFSSPAAPPKSVIRDTKTGKTRLNLAKADIIELEKAGWEAPITFSAKGRDNKTDIWGNIYLPSQFDKNKSYPVIEYIYAGPHDNHVIKDFTPYVPAFSSLTELGFIIVQIDGMGTSNRSKKFHDYCWQNIKDGGFPDRIKWIKEAAKQYPFMDISNVGIFGSSAGGQNAMGALLFHPNFYKVAVAASGSHDNRMDKMWWNELFMGYPVSEQYKKSSNVVNAHKLKGDLLLIVGEKDDNVDPASTIQVVSALIEAKKDFELLFLPGHGHTSGGDYGERKRNDFFIQKIKNKNTPQWNKID